MLIALFSETKASAEKSLRTPIPLVVLTKIDAYNKENINSSSPVGSINNFVGFNEMRILKGNFGMFLFVLFYVSSMMHFV